MALGIIMCCTQFILGRWLFRNHELCKTATHNYIAWVQVKSLSSRQSKKALQMVCEQFHSSNFHKAFEGLFLRRENIQTLHQALWRYIFTSGMLTQLLFSKSANDLK